MKKNILRLAIFLMLGLALIQSTTLIPTGTTASAPDKELIPIKKLDPFATFTRSRLAPRAPMMTHTVTTAADNLDNNNPTQGSLREAIRNANLSTGADIIEFNIPGTGPHTINVGSGLPDITGTVSINGYSQPGASPNTLPDGNNAVLKVEIQGQANLFGIGLVIAANDCVVSGLAIHGFNHAILIDGHRTVEGASGNQVQGNFIGTNILGTAVSADHSNGTGNFSGGVWIDSGGFNPIGVLGTANNNLIGGITPAARNLISGNGSFGVRITGNATANLVQGNFIGTNAPGTAALGGGSGVALDSDGNTIGGTDPGARNVISGNNYNSLSSHGISICCNATDNLVQANYIGTDVTGTVAVPNAVHGIDINGGGTNNNTIGGTTTAARNIISGNRVAGVAIGNTSGNSIQGNYIGTTATGTASLPNLFYGVYTSATSGAFIGGSATGSGNLISANARGGIEIENSSNIIVQGNLIGTQANGTGQLGNLQFGVRVSGPNNVIGGRAAGEGNTIAYNRLDAFDFGSAVIVFGFNTNAIIVGNSIHSNEGLGIDLGRNWITPNDLCDVDSDDGTNNRLQNYPMLSSASSSANNTTIQGTLNSGISTTYTIDFYSNDTCDPFGVGEGQTYLGSTTTTTDTNCNGSFAVILPGTTAAGRVITATATDHAGNTSEFSACIPVTPVNSPPDAVDDVAVTNENSAVIVSVLANDTDPDGDSISISSFAQGTHGSVVNNGNGTLTYTPEVNFNGNDSFSYEIADESGAIDAATVTLTISTVDDPPDAIDDIATTREDTAVTLTVRANDSDDDCAANAIAGVTQPANGSVLINLNDTITYTPNLDFSGADSFTYTLSCAAGSDTATVSITINPVNDLPVAVDDTVATEEGTPVTINVLANDSDQEGDALSVTSITAPANGTAVINADGTVTYTPNINFNGTNFFSYAVRDANGGIDTATVIITVTPINDPPIAADDTSTATENRPLSILPPGVLLNDRDIENDPLTAVLVSQPMHGAVTLNADGSFTYTPDPGYAGCDSFTYKCNDGAADSDTATVTINVNPSSVLGATTLSLHRGGFKEAVAAMMGDTLTANTSTQNIPTWTRTGNLTIARVLHTSTLLANGEVLVVGGTSNAIRSLFTGQGFLKRTELFDPNTNTWRRTGDLNTARGNHTATILPGGKVLVVGGTAENGSPLKSAELYNPATGTWARTSNPNVARTIHTATLLPNGKVLVAGGTGNGLSFLNSGELYDPATNTWTRTRNLNVGRWGHSATPLLNGKVLVVGGYGLSGSLIQNTAELYNPATDTWTRTQGNLNVARSHHTATMLLDGRVLAACGLGLSGILNSAELFDPSTERWTRTNGNLNVGRWAPTTTLLRDGKVLVAGGTADGSFSLNATNTAELYDPANGTWTRTTNLNTGRHSHSASLLHNNKVLIIGGMRGSTTLNTAELYDPFDPRPLTSTCSPITVTQLHGEGFFGNSRIARIENGRVGCVNVETGEVAECQFSTTGASAGLMWLDAVDGQYAKTGQAITLEGEPGGDWIVAGRVNADGTVPCVAPSGHDVGGRLADGTVLSSTCTVEEPLTPWNAMSAYGYYPLVNFSGLVCTSSNPHPDQAELNRTTTSCSGPVFCYFGQGAALNDINGVERDFSGFYYPEPERCHMIVTEGYEVPAAKRPATRPLPRPGSVNVSTPIQWRAVNPNVNIAN